MGWRFGCQPPNVSLVDLVIELEQEATVQDVNQALKEASNRYLDYTDELLSLSKKSKWPIPIIFAPLKINNLRATENRKIPRFRVFRQTRYPSGISERAIIIVIKIIHAIIWGIWGFGYGNRNL